MNPPIAALRIATLPVAAWCWVLLLAPSFLYLLLGPLRPHV